MLILQKVAERVGFEPTYLLLEDNSISSPTWPIPADFSACSFRSRNYPQSIAHLVFKPVAS